ncbi:MAG: hypothetical protein Fur0046_25980 [Cyanobacteria bacterium J069]
MKKQQAGILAQESRRSKPSGNSITVAAQRRILAGLSQSATVHMCLAILPQAANREMRERGIGGSDGVTECWSVSQIHGDKGDDEMMR